MTITPKYLKEIIKSEVSVLTDQRLITQINASLINPVGVMLNWDYGEIGQQFLCWSVFEHKRSKTGIAFCKDGFGPENPWGLIGSSDDAQSMGQDCGWFNSFLAAYLDGFAPTYLDIWRVFKTVNGGDKTPVSAEASWQDTWVQVTKMRELEPEHKFDCKCDAEVELGL